MIYTDMDGREQSGEVWSAGPLPNTVWVLTENGSVVVSARTRKEVPYKVPTFGPPVPWSKQRWAHEVLQHRRRNPVPEEFIDYCDPERDIAHYLWNRSIEIDNTMREVRATRYADRASISAKRLQELDRQ